MWEFDLDEMKYMKNIAFYNYYYLDIIHSRYKPILDDIADKIQAEKFKEFRSSYKDNYSKFVEDMFGIKLKWYQKQLINIMSKYGEIYHQIIPYKSGRKTQGELLWLYSWV